MYKIEADFVRWHQQYYDGVEGRRRGGDGNERKKYEAVSGRPAQMLLVDMEYKQTDLLYSINSTGTR